LELGSKTCQSFLVIIAIVGLLALMVNRKNLSDGQRVRLKDYLLEHFANGKLPSLLNLFQVMERVECGTCNGLKWRMGCDIGKKASGDGLEYNCDDVAKTQEHHLALGGSTVNLKKHYPLPP
jgi:hypothetical protein